MNWRFTACAVIAAGLMNGCAAIGIQTNESIKQEIAESCSLLNNGKAECIEKIDVCEAISDDNKLNETKKRKECLRRVQDEVKANGYAH
jgi:hypothetical protein